MGGHQVPRAVRRALGWASAGAAVTASAVAGYAAWTLSAPRRPWPPYSFTPFEIGIPAEDVVFRSEDGVELAGWWFDHEDAEVAVVVCHGHRGSKADMLGIGPGLHRAGHSVLVFDFRGNGESGDGPQSLAHHEQADVRAAIDLVREKRPDLPIAVVAFSMGAATAILEAASDDRVQAMVLDSPFATMRDVVAANFRRYRMPSGPILPLVDLVTRARYGYAFAQVRPLDVFGDLDRPILLLHGTEDRVIPFDESQRLAATAPEGTVELVQFEGVDHCGGYFEDRPGYIARVDEFLRRQLTQRGAH